MGILNNPFENNSSHVERPHVIMTSSESENEDEYSDDEQTVPDGYIPIPSDPDNEPDSDSDTNLDTDTINIDKHR